MPYLTGLHQVLHRRDGLLNGHLWIDAVLIRAPRIVRVGTNIATRAWIGSEPVWVETDQIIATTFHPELSDERRVHEQFLERAAHAAPFRVTD